MLIKKTAIILCGGKSSKGYKNKAFLRMGEKNFLDIIIEKISNFDEIIISCSNKKIFSNYSGISKIVEDDIQDIGPKESTFFRDVNNLEDYIDICSKSMQMKEIRNNSCFIVR